MAVEMIGIGRLVPHPPRKIGKHSGYNIQDRKQASGQNSQAACKHSEKNLQRDQHYRRANGGKRRQPLFARGLFDRRRRGWHGRDYTLSRIALRVFSRNVYAPTYPARTEVANYKIWVSINGGAGYSARIPKAGYISD